MIESVYVIVTTLYILCGCIIVLYKYYMIVRYMYAEVVTVKYMNHKGRLMLKFLKRQCDGA